MRTTRPTRAGLRCFGRLFALSLLLASPVAAHQAVDPAILRLVKPRTGPRPAAIIRPPGDPLVEAGRRLFFKETFGGNGRTCGTCHRAERNLTIDAEFIRRLPASDPLFVGERAPLIGLENPFLLRRHGLILENLDGFDNPGVPGVMRGVPHTLGLGLSTGPFGGSANELAGGTGWSGDGAPGRGSLREFAVGAVVQHFPKTLNRVPTTDGRPGDFVVPSEDQLDALLAFQLSTGRQANAAAADRVDPESLLLLDASAARGQLLFHGRDPNPGGTRVLRSCAGCHDNGGATTAGGRGLNVDTGVRLDPNAPACREDRTAPADGGFGATPATTVTLCGRTLTSRGDGRFNTPSVREAADTPPLFHNNSAATIEDAVRFYASTTFNASPAAGNGTFPLSDAEVREVAAFLRAINALDNIASAGRSLEGAIGRPSLRNLLRDPAVRDINDAIVVLTRGPVRLFSGTRPELVLARGNLNIARGRLTQAKADLASAAGLIGQQSP